METKTATYQTDIYTVYVTSNQSPDATIAAKKVSVSYTGLTTAKEVGNNGTVKVPAGLTPTATATDETGYAKTVTVLTASRLITAAYETTIVSINMVGENGGVEGAAPQGAQATVSYQGGTDQVLTDNTQTAKVPTGTAFTVTYANVSGYATPATYSATATGASMAAPKATYIYGVLQLIVTMSDSDVTALADVQPMISINGGTAAAMTGSAGIFTASMEANDTYEITFNSLVADGYQTPAAISGTFQGGVQTETAQYLTTILTLGSIVTTKDGNVQGQNPQGAGVTVAYTGQTSPATLTAINDSVKVPSNLTPTITPLAVQYYSASATLTGGSISVTYATVSRTVSITSNQASDAVIAAVVATLTYTYEGETVTRTGIADGTEVLIPATATGIAFTAPDVTGYAKSISGAAISYATTILTVVLASDTGEADLSGVTKTVTDTTDSTTVTPQQDGTYKIPTGHGYSVLDLVNTYSRVNNVSVPYVFAPRRAGASPVSAKKYPVTASSAGQHRAHDADVVQVGLDAVVGASADGDLELAMIPESFRVDALNETLDDNNVLIENANTELNSFALLFEFDGDVKHIRHVLYNCSASRPGIEGKTNEESREVQTETLTIKATPLASGVVKAKTGNTTNSTVYQNWYQSVYMPSDVSGANVNLSALTIGSISLDPIFAAGTTAYTAETSNATNAITATAADENAGVSITVNGDSLTNGSSATWEDGENTVVITVTNGGSSKTYTVVVTKE